MVNATWFSVSQPKSHDNLYGWLSLTLLFIFGWSFFFGRCLFLGWSLFLFTMATMLLLIMMFVVVFLFGWSFFGSWSFFNFWFFFLFLFFLRLELFWWLCVCQRFMKDCCFILFFYNSSPIDWYMLNQSKLMVM